MKGLLYREFFLTRKHARVSLLVFALLSIFVDACALSMRIGNLAKYTSPESLADIKAQIPLAALCSYLIALVLVPEAVYQTLDADFRTPWLKYILSSPLTTKQIVGAKYLSYFLMTLLALLAGLLQYRLCFALAGIAAPKFYGHLAFFSALFIMVLTLLILPMEYLFQSSTVAKVLTSVPFFLGLILFDIYAIASAKIENGDTAGFSIAFTNGLMRLLSKISASDVNVMQILSYVVLMQFSLGSYFLSTWILEKHRLKSRMSKGGRV